MAGGDVIILWKLLSVYSPDLKGNIEVLAEYVK